MAYRQSPGRPARTYEYHPGRMPILVVAMVFGAAMGVTPAVLAEGQSVAGRFGGLLVAALFVGILALVWMSSVRVRVDEDAGIVVVESRRWPLAPRQRGAYRLNEIVDLILEETPKGTSYLALVLKSGQRVPLSEGFRSRAIQERARVALREMLLTIDA